MRGTEELEERVNWSSDSFGGDCDPPSVPAVLKLRSTVTGMGLDEQTPPSPLHNRPPALRPLRIPFPHIHGPPNSPNSTRSPRPHAPHAPTWAPVSLVLTISSSGMMCAGLKKCAPSSRRRAAAPPDILAPTSSMSMVEVLVERMASGRQAFSRSV
mgnify:CR=1 FL=1